MATQTKVYNGSGYTTTATALFGATHNTSLFGKLNTGSDLYGIIVGKYGDLSNSQVGVVFDDDLVIPRNSTITKVTFGYRLKGVPPGTTALPYEKLGASTQNGLASFTTTSGFALYTQDWGTSSPDLSAFTPETALDTEYGLIVTGTPSVLWSAATLTIQFNLPTPTVTTSAATKVLRTRCTFNGTINPNSSTSTYPISYYFEYGKTDKYGTRTVRTGALTGTDDVSISESSPNTLTPNTTYHYRLVARMADGTLVKGADQTFLTPLTDTAIMRF